MLLTETLMQTHRATNPLIPQSHPRLMAAAVLAAGLWCAGCGDDPAPPAVPTTPATRPAAAVVPATRAPQAPVAEAQAGPIPWKVPADWTRDPGERAMRVATFRRGQPNEEIAVSQFPGDVGGVLANVNRWRAQVGLPPITDADLAKELQPFDNGKMKGNTMRLRGDKQHMLAAIIADPAGQRTWFVKCTTTPANADTLEANLNAFAASFGTGEFPAERSPVKVP